VITVPPSTPAGAYDVVVRAAYRTTRVRELSIPVQVENAPPVAVAPAPRLIRGTRASLTGVPIRLAWPPAIDESPIVAYEVGEVVPAPVDPAAVPPAAPAVAPAPDITVLAATGGAVRSMMTEIPFATPRSYAVRAADAPGNQGQWTVAPPAEVVVVGESSSAVRRSAGWVGRSSAFALGGRDLSATRAGAWLRHTFTGRGIALVGATGPLRGRAEVWLDGARVATIDTRSTASAGRVLLYAGAVSPATPHTIEVRVLGTPGRPRIDVDGFLVLR
jgi:hypothetical protein